MPIVFHGLVVRERVSPEASYPLERDV